MRDRKKIVIFGLIILLTILTISISFFSQKRQTTKSKAAENQNQYVNVGNLFVEKKTTTPFSNSQSTITTPIKKQLINTNTLPTTGTWKGKMVKVVPSDRFFPEYDYFTYYGIRSIKGLRDGGIIGGGLHAFFIKNVTDTDWSNLELVEVPQSFDLYGNVTLKIIETNQDPSDQYL
ncbi:hypothetical protein HYW87_02195, partial [Candidatus Roizmanbacteria bacterium]|nr:hypothetical protein [Candidatus Roizmanbacteria bacterium]